MAVCLRADFWVEERRFIAALNRTGNLKEAGLEIPVTVCSDDNRYKELVLQDTLTKEELTEERLLVLEEKTVRYAVTERGDLNEANTKKAR